MKLGILQQHNTADIANNKTRLAEGIIDLAHRGAELIVLQELHNSLYFCQVEDVELFNLAEPIPGPSTEFYGKLAKDLGVVIVTSLFERRAPGLYHNTAVVIEKDGSIAGKYRKMHIPDDPAYYEKFYFCRLYRRNNRGCKRRVSGLSLFSSVLTIIIQAAYKIISRHNNRNLSVPACYRPMNKRDIFFPAGFLQQFSGSYIVQRISYNIVIFYNFVHIVLSDKFIYRLYLRFRIYVLHLTYCLKRLGSAEIKLI